MPRLFLGNLGHDCRQRDIEKIFRGYGDLKNINIKGQYGFMEIEDRDDAEDAIKDINGKSFNGGRIKVEFSHAYSGNDRDRRGGGRRDFDRDRGGGSRRVSDGKFRRTNYRLVVQNISSGTSWQDLKDHMKQAGEIIYSTVNRNNAREGLVEFKHKEDMERAIDELDDSKLDGRRIKLVEEQRSPSRSRSRSRSGRRDRRRSVSKSMSRSRSRDRRTRPKSRSGDSRSRSRNNEDQFGRQRSPSRSKSRS